MRVSRGDLRQLAPRKKSAKSQSARMSSNEPAPIGAGFFAHGHGLLRSNVKTDEFFIS